MLLKIYTDTGITFEACTAAEAAKLSAEQLHLVSDVEDVVVHQGNWDWVPFTEDPNQTTLPSGISTPRNRIPNPAWGPYPIFNDRDIEQFNAAPGDTVRVIDYTKDGKRKRALIKNLCYVCNDFGKTIEKVSQYSGAKLSLSNAA